MFGKLLFKTKWWEPPLTRFETQQTILKYLPKKVKIQIFDRKPRPNVYKWNANQKYKVTNLDPMIIIESRTEIIKFERYEEESFISSQVLWRTNRRSKPHVCLDFHSKIIPWLQGVHTIYKTLLKIRK